MVKEFKYLMKQCSCLYCISLTVVEVFFLGEDTKYLEVELCP